MTDTDRIDWLDKHDTKFHAVSRRMQHKPCNVRDAIDWFMARDLQPKRRSCAEVCLKIINAAPDGPFKTEMTAFVDGIFCELPEDPFEKYWAPAGRIMNAHITGAETWHRKVRNIWFDQKGVAE